MTMYSSWATRRNVWVSPFRDLRVNVCLPTHRSLSQATTSFIAFCRQGIHHVRLVTWSYNLKRSRAQDLMSNSYILCEKNAVFDCTRLLKSGDTKSQASALLACDLAEWWSWSESNRRPPACKAGALPIELQPLLDRGPVIFVQIEAGKGEACNST